MARREEGGARKPRARATRSRRSIGAILRAGFRHHQSVAVDSLLRLLREPGASLLTWMVIGIALALPLCLLLLLQNLQQLGSGVEQASRLSLFMQDDIGNAALMRAADEVRGQEEVAAVEVITADDALVEFRDMSGFGDALAGLDDNPLPAVLVVTPAVTDARRLESMAARFAELESVASVQLDLEWVRRLHGILDLARRVTLGLALLLGLAVVLVVGNTVRLAIEGRRAEIVVVKLVGGTDAYVSRPFLYTGLWYGVGGGLLAWLVVLLGLWALEGPVSRLAGLYGGGFSLMGVDIAGLLGLLLISGLLGWFGAWISVLRHLRAIEPK